jgi:hypothetical protein
MPELAEMRLCEKCLQPIMHLHIERCPVCGGTDLIQLARIVAEWKVARIIKNAHDKRRLAP